MPSPHWAYRVLSSSFVGPFFLSPGTVFLQGLPFDRMVDQIARRIPGGRGGGMMPIPIGMGGGGGGGEGGEGTGGAEAGGDAAVSSGGDMVAGGAGAEGVDLVKRVLLCLLSTCMLHARVY